MISVILNDKSTIRRPPVVSNEWRTFSNEWNLLKKSLFVLSKSKQKVIKICSMETTACLQVFCVRYFTARQICWWQSKYVGIVRLAYCSRCSLVLNNKAITNNRIERSFLSLPNIKTNSSGYACVESKQWCSKRNRSRVPDSLNSVMQR